jgi:hypothetical protein
MHPDSGERAAVRCARCQTIFPPKRTDQRYCQKACAKAASRNSTRGSRKLAESPEAARIHESRKGRIRGLSQSFYETPPAYRAAFLQRLILEARTNTELRTLVTDRAFIRSWARETGTGRLHIAHVLNHFCHEVYGRRSFEVVAPAAEIPSPSTLAFPAEYFGPDAAPVYEDGALNQRPCPWKHRKKVPPPL